MESVDQILDQDNKPKKKREFSLLAYISLGLLALGVIGLFFDNKLGYGPAILGSLGMIVRGTLLFYNEKKDTSSWLLLFGKIFLILGIGASLFAHWFHIPVFLAFLPAMLCFALGIIIPSKHH